MKKSLLLLNILIIFGVFNSTAQQNVEIISTNNSAALVPPTSVTGAVAFNPANSSYINVFKKFFLNQNQFSITAWIKPESGAANSSIIARRNAAFSEGFDLGLNGSNNLEMRWWSNGSFESITSNTTIPYSIWHEIAIIYDGTTTYLYIDGVLDTQAVMDRPDNANWDLFIGASGEDSPSNFYSGSIDEVRFWNVALTTDQLHFMMNQQIEEDNNFVAGSFFLDKNFVFQNQEEATRHSMTLACGQLCTTRDTMPFWFMHGKAMLVLLIIV